MLLAILLILSDSVEGLSLGFKLIKSGLSDEVGSNITPRSCDEETMSHLQYYAYPGEGVRHLKEHNYNQAVRVGDRIECSGQGE